MGKVLRAFPWLSKGLRKGCPSSLWGVPGGFSGSEASPLEESSPSSRRPSGSLRKTPLGVLRWRSSSSCVVVSRWACCSIAGWLATLRSLSGDVSVA